MPLWLTPRLIAYGVAVAAIVSGVLWYGSTRYEAGEVAGRAAVQRQWDDEKRIAAEAFAKAAEDARTIAASDKAAAREIQGGLQTRLDTADGRARDLARRLRDYQARACSGGALPGAPDAATRPDSTGGESEDRGEVAALTAEHLAACARDAERLDGWREWWAAIEAGR